MNEDFQALKVNHQLLKDSLTVYVKIVEKKDDLILNKDKQIVLFEQNEKKYQNIIQEKDKQISEWRRKYRKEKILKHVGLGTTLISLIGLGILVL